MKLKYIISFTTLFLILSLTNMSYAQNEEDTQKIVDTLKDMKSIVVVKYAPDNSTYCSATMITPNVGITAKHCVGNDKKEGYVGAVYPGQSGIRTPFGYMNITSYIPDIAEDIAIIKGNEEGKSSDYKHYIKNFEATISPLTKEEAKSLEGKRVYSYGYPSNYVGSPLVRVEGAIKKYNIVNRTFDTTMPVSQGQSGAGVFLVDNERFVGVLNSGYKDINTNKDWARVSVLDQRLVNWFKANK
ncbi:trypsin-like serine peptidase [Staphylococcus coagulans]|uniref:trypsin-like serine peptidase n=1 Tax=Staphylococcus coagulans TaxID=74706 RepID=UPI0030EC3131